MEDAMSPAVREVYAGRSSDRVNFQYGRRFKNDGDPEVVGKPLKEYMAEQVAKAREKTSGGYRGTR